MVHPVQHRSDPVKQLLLLKRLGDIVIHSEAKSGYLIFLERPCRKNYHRYFVVKLLDPAGQCKTIHSGEHDVNQTKVGAGSAESLQRRLTVAVQFHLKPV